MYQLNAYITKTIRTGSALPVIGLALVVLALVAGRILSFPQEVRAQTAIPVTLPASSAAIVIASPSAQVATDSAQASDSALVPATIIPPETTAQPDRQDKNITDTNAPQKSKLAQFLEQNPPQPLSWYNFVEHAMRWAISRGVPANILVLILLFPLIASIIAASRHVIGLRGFGIYIPAVLSVALVNTGLVLGTIIFLAIISVATLSKRMLKNLHLSYLPRTALLLWMISLAILAVVLVLPLVQGVSLSSINIFPILILVLLSENFLDAQSSTKPADAFWLAVETLGLAFTSGLILRWEFMQRLVLLEPELIIVCIALFNYVVGKFVGLRISEILRFRAIIEE